MVVDGAYPSRAVTVGFAALRNLFLLEMVRIERFNAPDGNVGGPIAAAVRSALAGGHSMALKEASPRPADATIEDATWPAVMLWALTLTRLPPRHVVEEQQQHHQQQQPPVSWSYFPPEAIVVVAGTSPTAGRVLHMMLKSWMEGFHIEHMYSAV